MNLTGYHAKYFAYELTKRCASNSLEKLVGALVDAKVDLNPHQVEEAAATMPTLIKMRKGSCTSVVMATR